MINFIKKAVNKVQRVSVAQVKGREKEALRQAHQLNKVGFEVDCPERNERRRRNRLLD